MNKLLTFLIVLTFLYFLGSSSAVFSDESPDAMATYYKKDYKSALKLFLSNAEQGLCCRSQIMLGIMYEEGQGTPQDHEESVKWYRVVALYESEARFIIVKKYHE